jgi:hypothetical protein
MNETIRKLQDEFDHAELHADIETLQRLLTDDFLSIGPKGFMLDKQEWINRHVHFRYDTLDTSDMDIRLYDNTAIVRNILTNTATYNDEHVEFTLRVSQVWVEQGNEWRLAAIQFSPLANS